MKVEGTSQYWGQASGSKRLRGNNFSDAQAAWLGAYQADLECHCLKVNVPSWRSLRVAATVAVPLGIFMSIHHSTYQPTFRILARLRSLDGQNVAQVVKIEQCALSLNDAVLPCVEHCNFPAWLVNWADTNALLPFCLSA